MLVSLATGSVCWWLITENMSTRSKPCGKITHVMNASEHRCNFEQKRVGSRVEGRTTRFQKMKI